MDVDPDAGTVHVRGAFVERSTGELTRGLPKSRAACAWSPCSPGRRPARATLRRPSGFGRHALVFTGDKGAPLRRSNFNRAAKWPEPLAAIGAPGLHFHDLRHSGNLLAAASGASLRDLMNRMGNDSMRAALIYQHSTHEAERRIADAMERMLGEHERTPPNRADDGLNDLLVPTS